jgi:hypothetical protein
LFPLGNFGVGFDQIQIIQSAKSIMSGDFSLIGPRTGPADMFTGPLIYYLTIPFVFFFGELMAIFLTPLFISLITGIFLYFLLKRYLGLKEATYGLIIWAFSPFLISLDRIFWNPNLTLLSAALVFIPLLAKKVDRSVLFFVFCGSFLAYQAHFSGLLLTPILLITVIVLAKPLKVFLMGLFGLGVSLLPTLIFDLRNQFLNFNGLLGLLQQKSQFSLLNFLADFYHNLYIIIETFGKLFIYNNSPATIFSLGLLFFILALFNFKNNQKIQLAFLWVLFVAIAYSFYREQKPEYYFLIILPPLFIIAIDNLSKIKQKWLIIIFGFFIFNSILTISNTFKDSSGITVANLSQAQKYLANRSVKEIIYDVPFGAEVGVKYFFDDLVQADGQEILHVSYPNDLSFNGVKQFNDLAVWFDRRSLDKNYIVAKDYMLQSASGYLLYKNEYPREKIQNYEQYEIFHDGQHFGSLLLAHESREKIEWMEQCLKLKEAKNDNWQIFSKSSNIKYKSRYCLLIEQKQLFDLKQAEIDLL